MIVPIMASPKINIEINKLIIEKIIPKIAIVELLYFFIRLVHPVIRPIIDVIIGIKITQQNIKEISPSTKETIGKSLCFFENWFDTTTLLEFSF